ncbi:MAG: flagellar hook-length control protein FliK [Lachnospiraceae bacterium]|nr:flagellar hook-length control protein FliK [Lachnospiraceae bacterium]
MAISTKGISQVDLSSGIKSKNNLKSKAEEGAADSFSSLINMTSGNFKDENNAISDNSLVGSSKKIDNSYDTAKTNNVSDNNQGNKTATDDKINSENNISARDGKKTDDVSTATNEKVSDSSEVSNTASDGEITDALVVEEKIDDLAAELASLINQIMDTLKNMLGLGEEEMEDTISALDMNYSDFLNTENINEFVLFTEGATEVDILIDEQLATLVDDIVSDVNELLDNFEAFDISMFNNDNFEFETNDVMIPIGSEEFVSAREVFNQVENIITDSDDNQLAVENDKDETEGSFIQENTDNIISDESNVTILHQSNNSDNSSSSRDFASSNESIISNLNNAINNVVQDGFDESFGNTEGISQADIIRQVVDEIKANVTNDISTLEMRLNPESLGKVQITVSSRNGVMQAQIVAETEAAKNAIEENIATLRETLNNQDLKVEDVEVTLASYGFFEGQEQDMPDENNPNQTGGRNVRVNSNSDVSDDSVSDEQLESEMMRAQGNSVNYSI